MTLADSLPTQDSAGLSIVDHRLINASDVVRSTAGAPRLGILPAHTQPLVTALSSMAVSVATFAGITARTGAANGVEKIVNNGGTTVALAAAPSSNSRIDVVWVRAQFVSSGDANNLVVFGVTTGTAASNPQKSQIPAGALELATVLIPSTATTTQSSGVIITQTYLYTAPAGASILFRNDAEMSAFAPPPGTPGYRLDTLQSWQYDGSNWTLSQPGMVLIRPGAVTGGTVGADGTITVAPGGTSLRVDDCFSSRYRHYRIMGNLRTVDMSTARMRWTRGGAERVSNDYFSTLVSSQNGAAPYVVAEGSNSSFRIVPFASLYKNIGFDVFNPAVTDATYLSGTVGMFGGAFGGASVATDFETTLINDGFVIILENSSFQLGDIKIYAYA